jgi:hypothetical protein
VHSLATSWVGQQRPAPPHCQSEVVSASPIQAASVTLDLPFVGLDCSRTRPSSSQGRGPPEGHHLGLHAAGRRGRGRSASPDRRAMGLAVGCVRRQGPSRHGDDTCATSAIHVLCRSAAPPDREGVR